MLVFDEWAADQDPAFRHVFYTELLADLKRLGKTIIVISHDDRYFHCADRIVRLRDGRVDEAAAFVNVAIAGRGGVTPAVEGVSEPLCN